MKKFSTALSHRECEIISHLCDGLDWDSACDLAEVPKAPNSRRVQKHLILRKIGMSDLTGVVLWASKITDEQLRRLTGKTVKLSRSAGAG